MLERTSTTPLAFAVRLTGFSIQRLLCMIVVGAMMSCGISPLSTFPQNETNVVSVCEALSNLSAFWNNAVRIRGVLTVSFYHGSSALSDYQQTSTCSEVVKKGRAWPPTIYLEWPASESEEQISTFSEIFAQIRDRPDNVILGTFSGRLESKLFMFIRRRDDWHLGFGYGLSGGYPAKLVVTNVDDWQLIDRSSWSDEPME